MLSSEEYDKELEAKLWNLLDIAADENEFGDRFIWLASQGHPLLDSLMAAIEDYTKQAVAAELRAALEKFIGSESVTAFRQYFEKRLVELEGKHE